MSNTSQCLSASRITDDTARRRFTSRWRFEVANPWGAGSPLYVGTHGEPSNGRWPIGVPTSNLKRSPPPRQQCNGPNRSDYTESLRRGRRSLVTIDALCGGTARFAAIVWRSEAPPAGIVRLLGLC